MVVARGHGHGRRRGAHVVVGAVLAPGALDQLAGEHHDLDQEGQGAEGAGAEGAEHGTKLRSLYWGVEGQEFGACRLNRTTGISVPLFPGELMSLPNSFDMHE